MVTAFRYPLYLCPHCNYHHRVRPNIPVLCCGSVVFYENLPPLREVSDDLYFDHPSRLGPYLPLALGPAPEPPAAEPEPLPQPPDAVPAQEPVQPPADPDPPVAG